MDEQESQTTESAPLSVQIFEAYISELKLKELSPDVVSRLQKTIITNQNFSEQTLRSALFSDAPAI